MEREQITSHLQQVSHELLAQLSSKIELETTVAPIGKPTPQTLLLPVHDPINGGTFIGGEVLVTSCVVQVNGVNGWAMVMDDAPQLAQIIATLDAAWAAGIYRAEIEELVRLAQRKEMAEHDRINAMAAATKVSFDLL